MRSSRPDRRPIAAGLALALGLAVVALYAPARHFSYIGLDDNEYVYENPAVRSGLNAGSAHWAVTAYHSGHWHPLTWLSLMADVELFGLDPGASHAVNVLLHALAVALLFLALRESTGRTGASLLAAALFALHPLRVESVAWIAARKDVLSGVFLMALLWAWARYTRRETPAGYALALAAFALALLAKPTVVIAPFALLLLDWWPLGRLPGTPGEDVAAARPPRARRGAAWLVGEKLPFFALAGATLTQTLAAQQAAGAVTTGDALTLAARAGNVLWNVVLYLAATVWPVGLGVFYPLRNATFGMVAGATALLLAITAFAFRERGDRPWLLLGWLWFLGTLAPVSGIVQFGGQSMADRYSYIPHVGLLVAVAWEAASRVPRWSMRAKTVAALLPLAALAAVSRAQLGYWSDSITLFTHTLAVTKGNYLIENNLGTALEAAGRPEEAARHYLEAVRLNPTWPEALNNAGIAHAWQGRLPEAADHFARALRIRPGFAKAENNLGTALSQMGDLDGALVHYQRAVELDPHYFDALSALGEIRERRGELAEAEEAYARAVDEAPGSPVARMRLDRVRAARAGGR